jgi:hypothetical protein
VLILKAEESRGQALSEIFSEVTSDPAWLQWDAASLRWLLEDLPESDQMPDSLAGHYVRMNCHEDAVRVARELFKRNPDNSRAAFMLRLQSVGRAGRPVSLAQTQLGLERVRSGFRAWFWASVV